MGFIAETQINYVPLPYVPTLIGFYSEINDMDIAFNAGLEGEVLMVSTNPYSDLKGDEDIYTESGNESIMIIPEQGRFEVSGIDFDKRLYLAIDRYKEVDIPEQVQTNWDTDNPNEKSYIVGKPIFPKRYHGYFSFPTVNQYIQSPENCTVLSRINPSGDIVATCVANCYIATLMSSGKISPFRALLAGEAFTADDSDPREFSSVEVSWSPVSGAVGYILYFILTEVTGGEGPLPFSPFMVKSIGTSGNTVMLSLDRMMTDNIENYFYPDPEVGCWPCDPDLAVPGNITYNTNQGVLYQDVDITVSEISESGLISRESEKLRVSLQNQDGVGPYPALLTWSGTPGAAQYMVNAYDISGNQIMRGISLPGNTSMNLWDLFGYTFGTAVWVGQLPKPSSYEAEIRHLMFLDNALGTLDFNPQWVFDEDNLTITSEKNGWKGTEIERLGRSIILEVGKVTINVPSDFSPVDIYIEQYKETKLNKKVYTALLSQSGENDPTAVVLENTIGELYWARIGTGLYQIQGDNLFPVDLTAFCSYARLSNSSDVIVWQNNEGSLGVQTNQQDTNTDYCLQNYLFKIEVYERVIEQIEELPS